VKRIVKDPEERKQELIDTAERLFITRGYDQTSISDIVKEVNVSQGAFYYYFESKEDVLVAVVKKNMAAMEKDLRQIQEKDDMNDAAKLNVMINRFIHNIQSRNRIFGFLHHEKSATLYDKLKEIRPFVNIAPIMAEVISKGSKKGHFNVAHPVETSYLLLALLAWAIKLSWIDSMSAPKEAERAEDMSSEFSENMRSSIEDLIGRALETRDYKFILQI